MISRVCSRGGSSAKFGNSRTETSGWPMPPSKEELGVSRRATSGLFPFDLESWQDIQAIASKSALSPCLAPRWIGHGRPQSGHWRPTSSEESEYSPAPTRYSNRQRRSRD